MLKPDGSFVLNIGGSYNTGVPTRSLYHFKLLIELVESVGFHLAQECFWYNPAKMPMPAEWVTVRRIRVRDSVEYVWWLSKTPWPKANNRNVLKPYSKDMERLNRRGIRGTVRPSGHNIKTSFSEVDAGGSIPPNVHRGGLLARRTCSGSETTRRTTSTRSDARRRGSRSIPPGFPRPCLSSSSSSSPRTATIVLDPFAGSNTTGAVAESLGLRWIAVEMLESYLEASRFRFL